MASTEFPAWLDAATAAAVRLAAEAGTEVDDILEHAVGAPPERLVFQATRLEQSADLTEVATDLAGLLWAECVDVPLIATILEEPATQAALQAVAEARRQAARRLTDAAATAAAPPTPAPRPTTDPWAGVRGPGVWARAPEPAPEPEPAPMAARSPAPFEGEPDAFPGLTPLPPLTPLSRAEQAPRPAPPIPAAPAAAAPDAAGPAAAPALPAQAEGAPAAAVPPTRAPARTSSTGNRHQAAGAVLAGTAAAAILLFGRRLRRA